MDRNQLPSVQDEKGSYDVGKEFSGKGYCPYDPKHNSTSLFTGKKRIGLMGQQEWDTLYHKIC